MTPEGIRRGEQLAEIFHRADALAAEGLTPEEQEQLGILLEKVYRAAASDRREER